MENVTLSRFLRHSGEVLGAVAEADVVLARRDDVDLVLTTAPRTEAIGEGLLTLARVVLQALARQEAASSLVGDLPRALPGARYLSTAERERFLTEVAEAAITAVDVGATEPLVRALERWGRLTRARAQARPVSAHTTRPVAIPDDVDDPSIEKASGVVELPLHVRWSYPRRAYDLDDPRQRRLVYEQVLSEGLDDDVRRYIDVDTLVADWDRLVLPPRVRRAWADWLWRRRSIELAC